MLLKVLGLVSTTFLAVLAATDLSVSVSQLALKSSTPGEKPNTVYLDYPETTANELSASSNSILSLSFKLHESASSGNQFIAQYVALAIENTESHTSATFLCTHSSSGHYTASLNLALEAIYMQLSQPSGQHTLTLFVSDNRIRPFKYPLGTVDLEIQPYLPKIKNEANDVFVIQPEITHTMRKEEKMPIQKLSYIFTAVTLSPWMLFFPMWRALGANINNLFFSVSTALFGMAFLSMLAVLLGILFMYWCSLTIFELIGYGLAAAIPTALLGHRTLVCCAHIRESTQIKGK
ncbi:hypothetical protein BATDEDRAFT_34067 [Batrachochytrium dendrobatidis JAM81]|uniref:Ribophorin II n=2 Tax=Batrachochytrium dendrobatidis TaxID=109871 RepID=F4NV70_BATDJ|nr:uncharacterized protein BATDEDRAFT_34067 [Batrachochytrium dendrobatidis JAM81]EGF84073.1 hypothetical protein BATDEDRAFT_34067 [Batrachochytrium dendrobatidis JAM81]OAJ36536.1 hypothetical protein BDEG_20699 [Batrachochytrium dendrobatidis JEL423]|eukprot:XP_006675743.1 hypothetical protein BATDEDRAFT_34067 [Batrachochytrium dendrobatidis JAM81]